LYSHKYPFECICLRSDIFLRKFLHIIFGYKTYKFLNVLILFLEAVMASSAAASAAATTRASTRALKAARDRIIRVDHAGEYGANRIYAGQMAVLGTNMNYLLAIDII